MYAYIQEETAEMQTTINPASFSIEMNIFETAVVDDEQQVE